MTRRARSRGCSGPRSSASAAPRSSFATACCPSSTPRSGRPRPHGTPILRALALVHPDDETIARTSPLGFYLGDALLAQPVVVEGQTEREVYLPAAPGGWYDTDTGEHLDGRQTIWAQTPLDRVPIYARGGSVVALGPVRQHTREPARTLDVHAYLAPGRHESVLYDDAGDGWAFRQGAFWLGRFALDTTPERVALSVSVDGHHVPEWARWTVHVHGLGAAPARVTVDGTEAAAAWDGQTLSVETAVGAAVEIERN